MNTFSGYTKGTIASESQAALNNFKKGTKRDASAYHIFKNDLYYETFQRSFLANIKAHGLMMLLTQILILVMDLYNQELFQEKQSFVYSVFVTSLQMD